MSNEICVFGLNPNNGQKIKDELIGYIDVNRNFCFPNENVNMNFKRIELQQDKFER